MDGSTVILPMRNGDEMAIELDELADTREVLEILHNEKCPQQYYVQLAGGLWERGRWADSIEIAEKGTKAGEEEESRLALLTLLANAYATLARMAPRTVLANPHQDHLKATTMSAHPEYNSQRPPITKEYYYNLALTQLKDASYLARGDSDPRVMDVKAAVLGAKGDVEQAGKMWEGILSQERGNVWALHGRARTLFAKRQYRPALKTWQQLLSVAPSFQPDPRIGIGLSFYHMGEHDRARFAFERALKLAEAKDGAAQVAPLTLLGFMYLNYARRMTSGGTGAADMARREEAYTKGIAYVQRAFKVPGGMGTFAPGAAAALADHQIRTRKFPIAIKLAERALQFSGSRALISEAHLLLARAIHGSGTLAQAERSYKDAGRTSPESETAALASILAYVEKGEWPAALDALESLLRRSPRCIEALMLQAGIHTHLCFNWGVLADSSMERKKAKESYSAVLSYLKGAADGSSTRSIRKPARESEEEMWIEVARLWQDGGELARCLAAYEEAERIVAASLETDEDEPTPAPERSLLHAKVLNNLGVVHYNMGSLEAAQQAFQDCLTVGGSSGAGADILDPIFTAATYNLGIVYADLGEPDQARGAWTTVLAQHPEYVDAKARLALMAIQAGKTPEAILILKEALTSQPRNLELRALYTYYLTNIKDVREARDFSIKTLKEHAKHDVYALCAAGIMIYNLTRENKSADKEAIKARAGGFIRAAEFFDKALLLDPKCAIAAQGLAIAIAEGTLGAATTAEQRLKNARDALAIFGKVRESINDGCVYLNMGHSYVAMEAYDKAIENYETAINRYYDGKNVMALLCLARCWFLRAAKESSFAYLQKAIAPCRRAAELTPGDLSIPFNLAMILQKGLETLFEAKETKRTTEDLETAIRDCTESQALFEELEAKHAADKEAQTPYNPDMPYQRRRYGESLLKRSEEILASQRTYEATEAGRAEKARQARETERRRQVEADAEKQRQIMLQAAALAEQRKQMRDETLEWTRRQAEEAEAAAQREKDDEGKEKSRKRKATVKVPREARGGGDDSDGERERRPPKKKRTMTKGTKGASDRKATQRVEEEPEESEGEKLQGPQKGRKGKNFKSAEFVESDDSSEEDEAPAPQPDKSEEPADANGGNDSPADAEMKDD